MGAAGAGKTTVAQALARTLGWRFVEGDEYHSVEAVAKMRGGQALTDADRRPWLAALHAVIEAAVVRREPLVLTCSALHERYREVLRGTLRGVRFVFLKADAPTLRHEADRSLCRSGAGRQPACRARRAARRSHHRRDAAG